MYTEDLTLNNLQWLICHKTPTKPNHIYLIYMYKEDLALNNLQWLTCHKTEPNQSRSSHAIKFTFSIFGESVNSLIPQVTD